MEVMNDSFVFHTEWIADLPESYRDKFSIIAIKYGCFGVEPVISEDSLEFSIWVKIKRRIDADKVLYNKTCEKRAEAGRRGGFAKGRNNEAKIANAKTEIAKIANANFAKNEIAKIADTDNEFDNEFENDTHTDYEGQSPGDDGVCAREKLFLELWDKNPDVFGIRTGGLLRPKDFHAYFDNPAVTDEYIKNGMKNCVDSVRNGTTERRYIPSLPERFILGGSLSRFQTSVAAAKGKSPGRITSDTEKEVLRQYQPVSTYHEPEKKEAANGIPDELY